MVRVRPRVAGEDVIICLATLVPHRGVGQLAVTSRGFEGQFAVRKNEGENTGSSRLEASESVAGETVGSLLGVHVQEGDQLRPGEGDVMEIFLRILNVKFSCL